MSTESKKHPVQPSSFSVAPNEFNTMTLGKTIELGLYEADGRPIRGFPFRIRIDKEPDNFMRSNNQGRVRVSNLPLEIKNVCLIPSQSGEEG